MEVVILPDSTAIRFHATKLIAAGARAKPDYYRQFVADAMPLLAREAL